MSAFGAEWRELEQRAQRLGQRQLVVLSGIQAWCREQGLALAQGKPASDILLLSDRTLGLLEPVEAQHRLGTESGLLIVDAWARVDWNAVAAAAGTLRAGGLMLLLCPPLHAWPALEADDDGRRSLFTERLCALLAADTEVAVLSADQCRMPVKSEVMSAAPAPSLPTGDQQQAMAAIERVACGHRRRPLVLRADRGRGKSAALGMAAATLLSEGFGDILVAGPNPRSVDILFQHAALTLPAAQRHGLRLEYGDAQLRFVPPDVLLRERPEARLVLVDEAAAIPPALLQQILEHYPRVVFATTVHGYEGTGRGFDVRFRDTLNRLTPQWRNLAMHTPIRWREGDPLERLLSQWLLLDAEPAADADVDALVDKRDKCSRIEQSALAAQPELLQQLFGLLVVAHYQTSPEDLHLLLDSPAVQIYAVHRDQQLVAAALVMIEGQLPPDLAEAIDTGTRRLRGHLLAQSVAFHCAAPQALPLKAARVSRIAVHHRLRRAGIGSTLLRYIEQQAGEQGFDYIGSSFAADEQVVPFWLGQEYSPLRLGTRRDSCSGSHALLVAKPLSAAGVDLIENLLQRFVRQLPLLLPEQFQQLPPALVAQLLTAGEPEALAPGDLEEVRRYALGVIQYDTGAAALWLFCTSQRHRLATLPPELRDVLAMKVLQRHSWREVADHGGQPGRAAIDKLLRLAFRELLAQLP